jgi:hypothetical protein
MSVHDQHVVRVGRANTRIAVESIEVRNDRTPISAWSCSGRISSLREAYRRRVIIGHNYAEVVFSNCAGSMCAIRQRKLRIGAVKPQLGGGVDSSFRLLHLTERYLCLLPPPQYLAVIEAGTMVELGN